MDKSQFVTGGRNLFTFIVQMIIFLFCLGYIEFIYLKNIAPDKEVKETYQVSSCTVVEKHLTTKGHLIPKYRADFLLSYVANDKQIKAWATGNGLDLGATTNRASQEEILSQYDVGPEYECWFNPKNPNRVVLVLRHSWASTFPLLLPSTIALIVFYYILRSSLIFLGLVRVKAREIRIKRKKNK